MQRIVLAHSGSPQSSRAIARLSAQRGTEIVAMTLDLGQHAALDDIHERALAAGAARAHVLDVREEFADAYVLRALRAGVLIPPPVRALAWAILAKHLVETAGIEGASAVAYGGGSGTLTALVESLDPALKRIELTGESAPRLGAGSVESNLVGRFMEAVPRTPPSTPDRPAYVALRFQRGVPVAVNGIEMSPVELLQSLDTIAGAHGIGRLDLGEASGDLRTRVLSEAPAVIVLDAARAELVRLSGGPETQSLTSDLAARYARVLSTGGWHTPARRDLDRMADELQDRVTGLVSLRLHKGECRVAGDPEVHSRSQGLGAARQAAWRG